MSIYGKSLQTSDSKSVSNISISRFRRISPCNRERDCFRRSLWFIQITGPRSRHQPAIIEKFHLEEDRGSVSQNVLFRRDTSRQIQDSSRLTTLSVRPNEASAERVVAQLQRKAMAHHIKALIGGLDASRYFVAA
nr:hypothetical protein [Burkholderia ubonensis]